MYSCAFRKRYKKPSTSNARTNCVKTTAIFLEAV